LVARVDHHRDPRPLERVLVLFRIRGHDEDNFAGVGFGKGLHRASCPRRTLGDQHPEMLLGENRRKLLFLFGRQH